MDVDMRTVLASSGDESAQDKHSIIPLEETKSSSNTESSDSLVEDEVDVNIERRVPKGYTSLILGVHRVVYSPPPPIKAVLLPGLNILDNAQGIAHHVPSVFWLYGEIYHINRGSFSAMLALDFIDALIPTLNLYINDHILKLIEVGYKTDQMDVRSIATMLGVRATVSLASHLITYVRTKMKSKFESQVKLHFRYLRLQGSVLIFLREPASSVPTAELARLRGSIPEDSEGQDEESIDHIDIWDNAVQLIDHGNGLISTFSECALMYKMLAGDNGSNPLASILFGTWIIRALPSFTSDVNRMWSHGYLSHAINKDYIRMKVVKRLATEGSNRESVASLNLAPWVLQEFRTCMSQLKGIDLSHFYYLAWGMQSPLSKIITGTLDEAPTLYYIFSAMLGWSRISFATISTVQGSSRSLRYRFKSLFSSDEGSVPYLLAQINQYFTAVQVGPDPDEQAVSYPGPEKTHPKGMAIEFSNVTFNYSGSKAKQPAIRDVSFSILPGQLIVIVGANGSGKTSMVKLLTRIHEPSTGVILIDGRPAQNFKRCDLREATAVLSQDHALFGGLSIAEDVGLGRWKAQQRRELIEQALHLGGATHLMSKLNAGADTVLSPARTKDLAYQITSGPLKRLHDNIEKESSVSGGEKQRLVAARTFMRMNTGDVKLVVVDEPSAAMDPAGEFELFKHLREARQGKTMIFITHRFGHLTKHADAIFCMKDGELVERGTHAELVERKGEYFNLYNIQAQAFAAEVAESGIKELDDDIKSPEIQDM